MGTPLLRNFKPLYCWGHFAIHQDPVRYQRYTAQCNVRPISIPNALLPLVRMSVCLCCQNTVSAHQYPNGSCSVTDVWSGQQVCVATNMSNIVTVTHLSSRRNWGLVNIINGQNQFVSNCSMIYITNVSVYTENSKQKYI